MSFEAVAWVMKLPWPLGTQGLKMTLLSLADRVDEQNMCFPTQARIGEDSVQSVGSVKRRLEELEQIGLIARYARFKKPGDQTIYKIRVDGSSRTSDEYLVAVDMSRDEFVRSVSEFVSAKRASKESGSDADQGGSVQSGPTPPSSRNGGVESEPDSRVESEPGRRVESGVDYKPINEPTTQPSPPYPPPGGGREFAKKDLQKDEALERDVLAFRDVWVEPVTDIVRLANALRPLSAETRARVLLGAKGYAAFVKKERDRGRNRTAKLAHLFVVGDHWLGYVPQGELVERAAASLQLVPGSEQWRAWEVFSRCANFPLYMGGKACTVPTEWPAFGRGWRIGGEGFVFIQESTPQWWAWLKACREWGGRGMVVVTDAGGARGAFMPGDWPPRKALQYENFPAPGSVVEEDVGAGDADVFPIEHDADRQSGEG